MATESTRDCLITIERAVADPIRLLDEFAGGELSSDVLDRDQPWLVKG